MTSRVKKVTSSFLAFAAALSLLLTPVASPSARVRGQGPRAGGPRSTAAQASAAKWERYTFPGDEFSVELPGMPFVFRTIRCISDGCRDSDKVRVFGHYADGVVFMIAAFDEPRARESFEDFAGHVRFTRSFADAAKRAVTASGFEGSEFRSVTRLQAPPPAKDPLLLPGDAPAAPPPAGTTVVQNFESSRVFKTKSHAYLVKAMSQTERHPLAERFLDSLTLSDKPQGREIVETAAPPPVPLATPPAASGPGRGENAQTDAKDQPVPRTQPADDIDPKRVFNPKEVTQKAVIVYKGDPGFTEEARKNNVTGAVRLRLVLTSAGRVANISVVRGLPDGLTERAIYAARHALFFPAQKDGRDVSQNITFEYHFNIYVE